MDDPPTNAPQAALAKGALAAGEPQAYPNFDYLRLAAAASVIFSHSYLLAYGNDAREPFVRLLGEGNILGYYGVFVFFVISGFLITQSACNIGSVFDYAWHRVLRIFPALACCAAVSALVLGAIFTSEPKLTYLTSALPLKYVLHAVLTPGSGWSIPTVRFYSDPLLGVGINGALWTIPCELICYVIVGALLLARQLRLRVTLLLCAGSLIVMLRAPNGSDLAANLISVAPAFACGAVAYFARSKGWLRPWLLAPCALVAACALWLGKTNELFPVFAAYPLIWAATSRRFALPSLRRFGDISYGSYLYGWPTEQVWRSVLGPHAEWWQICVPSLICAATLGFISWRLVERPALRLKRWRVTIFRDARAALTAGAHR